MDMYRMQRINNEMSAMGLRQMLVCDPAAVFYITGKWIFPGERFSALLIRQNKTSVMFENELFCFDEEIGVEKVYFSDGDDIVPVLKKYVDKEQPLGVDKTMTAKFILPILKENVATALVDCSKAVDICRSCKSIEEQAAMKAASVINDKAMGFFTGLVKTGITEIEVAEKIEGIYKRLGAQGNSFEPIVGFGANAADPHHMPDKTELKEGDCVLFDVGCVLNNYCSDMTRTFFWKKAPDEEAAGIYNLVKRANEEAESILKPGIPLAAIDKTARDIIIEGGHGSEFTHRLGHFIGIEVHESGDVSQGDSGITAVGNTFSIEPGIYARGRVGVRIEDLVLITTDGHEILNKFTKELTVLG